MMMMMMIMIIIIIIIIIIIMTNADDLKLTGADAEPVLYIFWSVNIFTAHQENRLCMKSWVFQKQQH